MRSTILVVGKESHDRRIVVGTLQCVGWRVLTAITAEEGATYCAEVDRVVFFWRDATFEEMRKLFPGRQLIPLTETLSMLTYARALTPPEKSRPALATKTRP